MSLIMRKPAFCICENKALNSCAVTAQLISAFVFAIQIVQSLYYLNPKFQASSHASSVAVQPGFCQTWSETPKTGFSHNEAHISEPWTWGYKMKDN